MRATRLASLFFLVAIFFTAPSLAQVPDPAAATSAPIPGAGHHYIGIGTETVNPADGLLSFNLPIQTPAGRQLTLPFGFRYSSSEQFYPTNLNTGSSIYYLPRPFTGWEMNGWSYDLPTLAGSARIFAHWQTPVSPPNVYQDHQCDASQNYVFRGMGGAQYTLGLGNQWIDPNYATGTTCQNSNFTSTSSSRHGIFATMLSSDPLPPIAVTDQSGTTYKFSGSSNIYVGQGTDGPTWSSLAATITDRNGNQISGGGSGYTDTLGRTVVSWTGFGNNGDQVTVSGLSTKITLHWTDVPVTFPETFHTVAGTGSCVTGNTAATTINVVSEIDLPNGQKYTFAYDPTHGRVSKIIFPAGGYVRYIWGLNTSSAAAYFPTQIPVQGGTVSVYCDVVYDNPAVTDRYVSFDGTTEVLHQHFAYSTQWNSSTPYVWNSKSTTVTTTDLLTSQVTSVIYNYVDDGADTGGPFDFNYANNVPRQAPVEQSVLYQDGSGHTLKTVNKTWLNPFAMVGEQTILDNGQGITSLRCYDGNEQVGNLYEYGFQSEGAKPNDPSCASSSGLTTSAIGPLKRQTATVFHNFVGASPSTHIVNAPDSVTLTDGAGNQANQISFSYDANSVQSSGATTGLAPPSTLRGNVSSVAHWLSTGGTSPTTSYAYFDTGQVQSITDACGNTACPDMTGTSHTSTYSYADNFVSGTGTPPGQTSAYLTQVTHPNTGTAHIEKFTWGYSDGLIRSSIDQNSLTTSYQYSDPLLRLTQINYPDGGMTAISYNDAPYSTSTPSPSVITSKAITSTTNLTTLIAFDGLGHTVRSVLTSDPDCASGDRTDTTYDGLGRAHTVSNPYCSTSDSTYGLTTYSYDALGRTIQVTHPDSSTVLTTYTGRATQVQDEGNGNGTQRVTRISQSDALGRLKYLCEVAPGPFIGAGGSSSSSLIGSGGTPADCSQNIPGGLDLTRNGFLTSYQYDTLGNLIQVNQTGIAPRTFTYDSLSRLLTASNPESATISYVYDANGNLSTKTAPAPNQPGSTTTTVLIGTQSIASAADSDSPGEAEAFQATATTSGQVASLAVYVDTPSTATQLIAGIYADAGGQPGSLLAQGSISAPHAGAWNNVSISPVSLTQGTAYWIAVLSPSGTLAFRDGTGCTSIGSAQTNLSALPATWSSGESYPTCPLSAYGTTAPTLTYSTVTTTYQYDALNRVTQKSYNDGSTPTTTYAYDVGCNGEFNHNPIGRLGSSSVPGWGFCYSYDPNGRLTEKGLYMSVPAGLNRQFYTYDLLGNITSETAGYGGVNYSYNTAARLISIANICSWGSACTSSADPTYFLSNAGNGSDTHYNALGQLSSDTLGNGEAETYTYDKRGRRQSYIASFNNTPIYSFNINSFAPNGDVLSANDTANGNWVYGYDAFNRLTCSNLATNGTCASPTSGTPTYSYVYDRFGNRWQQNGPNSFLATFTGNNPSNPQNNNRLDGYSYDAAGNLLNDGTHTYTYDAENRMIQVDGGNTATFVYDADGNRVEKINKVGSGNDPAGTWQFLYDQSGRMIQRYDGTFWNGNVYAGDRFLANVGGGTHFQHSDWLGTQRLQTTFQYINNPWYYAFCSSLPFGDGLSCKNGSGVATDTNSNLHFTGKERDATSGLDYFGARFDASSFGRFMSPDSPSYSNHANPQSWNLYAYALNNPVSFRDADGHEVVCANNTEQCKRDAAAATANAEAAKRVTTNTVTTKHSFLGIKWTTSKTTIAISGDINSFRNLSANAAKLADLVTSDKTVTVNYDRSVASEGNTGGFELYGKATSRLQSQGFAQNQTWIDPRRDPSWQWDDDAVEQGIPQSNTGEEFAHEVLGHVWGDLFGGAPAGTKGNQRDSIKAENAVRALDPTRGQKGLESHHGYAEMKNP